MRKQALTLLEMMIALCLIAIVGGVMSFRMREGIERKKFRSEMDRLQDRMRGVQKLAIATETDWQAVLQKTKEGWSLSFNALETDVPPVHSLALGEMEVEVQGKKVQKGVRIDFFSSGDIAPRGVFLFKRPPFERRWDSSELSGKSEGTKEGPTHP